MEKSMWRENEASRQPVYEWVSYTGKNPPAPDKPSDDGLPADTFSVTLWESLSDHPSNPFLDCWLSETVGSYTFVILSYNVLG